MSSLFRVIIPGAYSVVALAVWVGFTHTPADGLANFGLALMVLPYTVLDRLLSWLIFGNLDQFLFGRLAKLMHLPQGYLWENAYFYFPGIAIVLACYFLMVKLRSHQRLKKSAQRSP